MKMVDRERFWRRVEVLDSASCWLWTGAKDGDGYGKVKTPTIAGRRWILGAHRVSFFLENGPFDASLCVCHRCDVPLCVNPSHLFLGTHADNVADRLRKGRGSSGAKHSLVVRSRTSVKWNPKRGATNKLAKLTDEKVRAARLLYASGDFSQRDLGRMFDVSHVVMGKALRRETWEHVP